MKGIIDKLNIIHELGFKFSFDVEGRLSIADLVPKSRNRCGIYLLEFTDGLCYIGKAVDIVRRFSQHRKNHDNIDRFYFQNVPASRLDDVEKPLISQAETKGLLLTNKVHVTNVAGETDLDAIFTPEEQQLWNTDPTSFRDEIRIISDAKQRLRYRHNFEKFQQHVHYEQLVRLLRQYVQECLPAPCRTELSFWSVSCTPSTGQNSWPRLACVNVNSMETFVVGYDIEETDQVWCFVNISESIFREVYRSNKIFHQRYSNAEVMRPKAPYLAGGNDQIQIHMNDLETGLAVLNDDTVLKAARNLNLRLMRKGAVRYSQYHCFDLADLLV